MVRISSLSGVPFRKLKQPPLLLSGTEVRTTIDIYNFISCGRFSVKIWRIFLCPFISSSVVSTNWRLSLVFQLFTYVCSVRRFWNELFTFILCCNIVATSYIHGCNLCCIIRGSADKSLARPERKQATATKLGVYSTYSPRSSVQFLARCSNFCKPLKKKFRKLSIQPRPRDSNDLRVGRKMATFQLFFSV